MRLKINYLIMPLCINRCLIQIISQILFYYILKTILFAFTSMTHRKNPSQSI
ncbi:hypothetical protein OIU78_007537 [Salix suchowensis]|nr:hypothetical protein OIU78_007537 [Salix suchowensis]